MNTARQSKTALLLALGLWLIPLAGCDSESGTPASGSTSSGSGGTGGGSGGSEGGGGGGAGADGGTGGTGGGESCPDQALRQRFGMNIDPANPGGNPSAAELRDAGARWARVEWKVNEDYAVQDPKIAALREGDVRVLLLIDYSSVPGKPASNASDGEWDAYRGQFLSGASEIAQHYGDGVDAWQIWNEPDLADPGSGYDPGVPAHQFGLMLAETTNAIRGSSSRPIVTGGLASGNPAYLADAQSAAGGTLSVDGVSVHPYGQRAPDDWPDSGWGFGNMSSLFDAYLAFGKPLWVTEIGTVDAPLLADYLENVYALAAGYGEDVPVVLWFCWSDAMVPPFGLLEAGGTPKPAFERYQAIAPPWDSTCDAIP